MAKLPVTNIKNQTEKKRSTRLHPRAKAQGEYCSAHHSDAKTGTTSKTTREKHKRFGGGGASAVFRANPWQQIPKTKNGETRHKSRSKHQTQYAHVGTSTSPYGFRKKKKKATYITYEHTQTCSSIISTNTR